MRPRGGLKCGESCALVLLKGIINFRSDLYSSLHRAFVLHSLPLSLVARFWDDIQRRIESFLYNVPGD